ncbi:uncharacterized protein LOC144328294 [Podarcis muralis]
MCICETSQERDVETILSLSLFLEGIDFDEDQISEIGLEDGEDLPPSIPTTASLDAADLPPESGSRDQLNNRLTDFVARIKSGMIRRKALRDLCAFLQKIQEHPSAVIHACSYGQLVAISCLCALDPDPESRQRAAEALCHLLPILWHNEGKTGRMHPSMGWGEQDPN